MHVFRGVVCVLKNVLCVGASCLKIMLLTSPTLRSSELSAAFACLCLFMNAQFEGKCANFDATKGLTILVGKWELEK